MKKFLHEWVNYELHLEQSIKALQNGEQNFRVHFSSLALFLFIASSSLFHYFHRLSRLREGTQIRAGLFIPISQWSRKYYNMSNNMAVAKVKQEKEGGEQLIIHSNSAGIIWVSVPSDVFTRSLAQFLFPFFFFLYMPTLQLEYTGQILKD